MVEITRKIEHYEGIETNWRMHLQLWPTSHCLTRGAYVLQRRYAGTSVPKWILSCSKKINVSIVCGPRRTKAGMKPWHTSSTQYSSSTILQYGTCDTYVNHPQIAQVSVHMQKWTIVHLLTIVLHSGGN